jgi:hypothetical protein
MTVRGQLRALRSAGVNPASAQIGGKNDTIACEHRNGANALGAGAVLRSMLTLTLLQNQGGLEHRAAHRRRKSWPFAALLNQRVGCLLLIRCRYS